MCRGFSHKRHSPSYQSVLIQNIMNPSSKKWHSIFYTNCWKLLLHTFKHALEYINNFGNTFWSLSWGTEALCVLFCFGGCHCFKSYSYTLHSSRVLCWYSGLVYLLYVSQGLVDRVCYGIILLEISSWLKKGLNV